MSNARSSLPTRRSVLLASAWLLLGLVAALLSRTSREPVWPGAPNVSTFADSEHGGGSTAHVDTSRGLLHLRARLDSGAQYPLAGAIVHLAFDSGFVDMSTDGALEFDFGPSDMSATTACLVEDLPGFTRSDAWQTARYECVDMELLPGTSVYRIPLERFLTPSWWYATSGLRPSQTGPEKRSRIVRIVIQTTEGTLALGRTYDLRIHSIAIVRARTGLFALCLVLGVAFALLQLLGWGRRRPSDPPRSAAPSAPPVVFQPVEARSYADREREAVIGCIGREYVDPDLSLEKVARSTGVPLERVTAHVKAASGLLFKAYLNRVRGEAAHKLLLETDLPVSEIASRVGYGSPPHFNRVFREIFGTTPTAVRDGKSAPEESDPIAE